MTRAADVAPAIREAFAVAASGRPGPVLVDITKDAQLGTCEFDWDAARRPISSRWRGRATRAASIRSQLINAAERPLILAGHGIILGGAEAALQAFAEKAQIPIAMTLLGIGGFPASHPLNLGMMGMHGEAWVNTAIQEADLLIALGMRFDDRVTGNLKTYAPHAKKIHVDIDPRRVQQERPRRRRRSPATCGAVVREWLPRVEPTAIARRGSSTSTTLKGDSAVRDIQNLPDDGHLYAAHVINDLWRITEGNAVVVTDVGQHQMWEAQYYKHETAALAHHVGRPGHDGLRAAGGDRRQGGPARTRKSGWSSATAASR